VWVRGRGQRSGRHERGEVWRGRETRTRRTHLHLE